jgi:3-hydroxy-9,10-secoandrosta-1,3,5(10)-triene-9,17-dione monooxygenase reductase component
MTISPREEVEPSRFREVLGHFLTGVVLVTAVDDGMPVGMTCQSISSLSLDPPLVLFCPSKTSTTWPRIARAGRFCLNILAEDQGEVCASFARPGIDKFSGITHSLGRGGSPVIDGSLAHVECMIDAVHEGGDHFIVVGRAFDLAIDRDSAPLTYFRGGFRVA